jgi:Tfp pilus assembly protein FimV
MDERTAISLTLAKAFIEQGHEDMARSIITKLLIDNGLDAEDDELIESTQG